MLSFPLAQALKEAGLVWKPSLHDFFTVPLADLSDRLFVVSDLMADISILHGWPAITFNGTVEWALDYILTIDAVWVPTETQLRELVAARAGAGPVVLTFEAGRSNLLFMIGGEAQTVTAGSGSDAYARALLLLLAPANEVTS